MVDPAELGQVGTHERALHDDHFRRSLEIREAAGIGFSKLENNQALRRALLGGVRVAPLSDLDRGDILHMWRAVRPRKRGMFVGPARILGIDVHGY